LLVFDLLAFVSRWGVLLNVVGCPVFKDDCACTPGLHNKYNRGNSNK